jgi:uncharacterized RDD family membrane protein YckC
MYDAYAMATTGALAAVPLLARSEPALAPAVAEPPLRQPSQPRQPRQAMLFQDRPSGKVISFDGQLEPLAPPKSKPVTRTATRVQPRRAANDAQPMLEFFQPAPPAPRKLSTTVEAVIECDAPVAAPMHRACASAIDASMIVIACGLFFAIFYFSGGQLSLSKPVLLVMGTAAFLIAMFYGFVWVWAGRQTLGMRALSLTLTNFDGYPPDAAARWLRFMGACLGFCAGGLGLLWALLDEESLGWHDHISKTFPTFRGPETSFVRRR